MSNAANTNSQPTAVAADQNGHSAESQRSAPVNVEREKAEFGGMHFFLAFFGWLTATGLAVLLSAAITGILAAVGVQNGVSTSSINNDSVQTASIVSLIVLAIVLFVSYYTGGYVAGRMARFSGAKQGLAVWLWALIIAVLVAIVGAVAGSNMGAFDQLNSVNLPVSGSTATTAGLIALAVAVVFSLGGALLGGKAGMRFHRKVDRFNAAQ